MEESGECLELFKLFGFLARGFYMFLGLDRFSLPLSFRIRVRRVCVSFEQIEIRQGELVGAKLDFEQFVRMHL